MQLDGINELLLYRNMIFTWALIERKIELSKKAKSQFYIDQHCFSSPKIGF